MSKISLGTKLALVTSVSGITLLSIIVFMLINNYGYWTIMGTFVGGGAIMLLWIWFIDKRWPKNPNETRSESSE